MCTLEKMKRVCSKDLVIYFKYISPLFVHLHSYSFILILSTENDNHFPLYYQIRDMNQCKVETALEVRGNNVKIYGIFCEHTTENQMIWKGNNGTTLFFQCDLPYDATSTYADKEYAGYVVHDSVENHTAKGVGVYSNITVNNVQAARGISHPQNKPGVTVEHPYTIFLSNKGGVTKVINDEGPKVPRMGGNPEKQIKMARV